jgi:hypothetical protein
MQLLDALLSLPAELELWLILGYVAVVLAGAGVVERLARVHFERARRHGQQGFEYVAEEDHYLCPEGERLSLHVLEEPRRLAVYRAPTSRCGTCRLKDVCVPHGEEREIYRSLADWAETDVGRFHRRISGLMFAAACALSVVGLWRWGGGAGTGLTLLALLASVVFLSRALKGLRAEKGTERSGSRSPSP